MGREPKEDYDWINDPFDEKKIAEEREEEAYQKIKDAFGVDPVRIAARPHQMRFAKLDLDQNLQTAEIYYQYNGENIVYFVNASYTNASWGVDAEDYVTDSYNEERSGQMIKIQEYQIADTELKRYSASYTFNGVEYFLIGTISKADFELIIENLHFNL